MWRACGRLVLTPDAPIAAYRALLVEKALVGFGEGRLGPAGLGMSLHTGPAGRPPQSARMEHTSPCALRASFIAALGLDERYGRTGMLRPTGGRRHASGTGCAAQASESSEDISIEGHEHRAAAARRVIVRAPRADHHVQDSAVREGGGERSESVHRFSVASPSPGDAPHPHGPGGPSSCRLRMHFPGAPPDTRYGFAQFGVRFVSE